MDSELPLGYCISNIQRTNHSAMPPYSLRPEHLALADLVDQEVYCFGSYRARFICMRPSHGKDNPAGNGPPRLYHILA
jgi:hypothetical protein